MHVETREIRAANRRTTVVRLASEFTDAAQTALAQALAAINVVGTGDITVDLSFLSSNDGAAIETLIEHLISRPEHAGMLNVIVQPHVAERLRTCAIDSVIEVTVATDRRAA